MRIPRSSDVVFDRVVDDFDLAGIDISCPDMDGPRAITIKRKSFDANIALVVDLNLCAAPRPRPCDYRSFTRVIFERDEISSSSRSHHVHIAAVTAASYQNGTTRA